MRGIPVRCSGSTKRAGEPGSELRRVQLEAEGGGERDGEAELALGVLGVVVAGGLGVDGDLALFAVDEEVDGDTGAGVAADLLLTVAAGSAGGGDFGYEEGGRRVVPLLRATEAVLRTPCCRRL